MRSLVWGMVQEIPRGRRARHWDRRLLLNLLHGGGGPGGGSNDKKIQALAVKARKQFCDCGGMAAVHCVLANPDKVGKRHTILYTKMLGCDVTKAKGWIGSF